MKHFRILTNERRRRREISNLLHFVKVSDMRTKIEMSRFLMIVKPHLTPKPGFCFVFEGCQGNQLNATILVKLSQTIVYSLSYEKKVLSIAYL